MDRRRDVPAATNPRKWTRLCSGLRRWRSCVVCVHTAPDEALGRGYVESGSLLPGCCREGQGVPGARFAGRSNRPRTAHLEFDNDEGREVDRMRRERTVGGRYGPGRQLGDDLRVSNDLLRRAGEPELSAAQQSGEQERTEEPGRYQWVAQRCGGRLQSV